MLNQQTHHQAGRVPAARNQAAEDRFLSGERICVEGLRVEAMSEGNHFFFLDRDAAELIGDPHLVILEETILDRDSETLVVHSISPPLPASLNISPASES